MDYDNKGIVDKRKFYNWYNKKYNLPDKKKKIKTILYNNGNPIGPSSEVNTFLKEMSSISARADLIGDLEPPPSPKKKSNGSVSSSSQEDSKQLIIYQPNSEQQLQSKQQSIQLVLQSDQQQLQPTLALDEANEFLSELLNDVTNVINRCNLDNFQEEITSKKIDPIVESNENQNILNFLLGLDQDSEIAEILQSTTKIEHHSPNIFQLTSTSRDKLNPINQNKKEENEELPKLINQLNQLNQSAQSIKSIHTQQISQELLNSKTNTPKTQDIIQQTIEIYQQKEKEKKEFKKEVEKEIEKIEDVIVVNENENLEEDITQKEFQYENENIVESEYVINEEYNEEYYPNQTNRFIYDYQIAPPVVVDNDDADNEETELYSEFSELFTPEIDRYFKLGRLLAHTEGITASMSPSDNSMAIQEVEEEKIFPTIGETEEFDPYSTYYYLGNVYAGTTKNTIKKSKYDQEEPLMKCLFPEQNLTCWNPREWLSLI